MDDLLEKYLERIPMHTGCMEALLAELQELTPSLPVDDYLIIPEGIGARGYSKDVLTAKTNKNKSAEYLVQLTLCREGLYDMIPPAVCHPPLFTDAYQNIEALVEESNKVKEEEAAARRFFLPVEQVFYQTRIDIEGMERRYMAGFLSGLQKKILDDFWHDVKGTNDEYKTVLFYMLPLAHRIAGNTELMEQCFETILLDKVKIQYLLPKTVEFDDALTPKLEENLLGVNSVIGNAIREEIPSAKVSIGPLELSALADYLPGGKKAVMLPVLYDFFFPLEVEIETDISLNKEALGFILSENPSTSRVGYSTIL